MSLTPTCILLGVEGSDPVAFSRAGKSQDVVLLSSLEEGLKGLASVFSGSLWHLWEGDSKL